MIVKNKGLIITEFLNATLASIKSIVPVEYSINKPQRFEQDPILKFGVLIGVLGDINGKLIFAGNPELFSSLGQVMYGMPLEGEMLNSFSGELANMIAGGISTNLSKSNTIIDITTPVLVEGKLHLLGRGETIEVPINFNNIGSMNALLLVE